jgi:putative transposase
MARLLTGYATSFNRRHRRHGHVFQNRYKSIICQEDAYLKELVRYIHLNPLRAGIVPNVELLERFRWCGHGVLLGKQACSWQDSQHVLALFGRTISEARRLYRVFVREGSSQGRREELVGGGIVRSQGGWTEVKSKRRSGRDMLKGDERILGDSSFVMRVLADAGE